MATISAHPSTGTQPQHVAQPPVSPPKPYRIHVEATLFERVPDALAGWVYVGLAKFADREGYCWPSVATLARTCKLSERRVQYALRALSAAGLIEVEDRSAQAQVSRYRVVPPPMAYKVEEGEGARHAPPRVHGEGARGAPRGARARQGEGARSAPEVVPAGEPQATTPTEQEAPRKASAAGAAAPVHGTNGHHRNGHRPPTAEQGSLLPAVVAPPPEEPPEALWASHPIKALFQSYECQYLARQVRLGKAEADRHPPFGAKEGALAKRMLAQYGVPRVRALVAAFFSWDHADAWTARVGYHFASFHQQLGRLTSATPIDTLDARTMGNVKAAYSFATAPPNRRTL